MRLHLQYLSCLLLISFGCFAQAYPKLPGTFDAKITRIVDGDSFEAVYNDSLYRFRLLDIDAPEYGQDFFEESKLLLTELTTSKEVMIENKGEDKYGRILGIVIRKKDQLNINREIVKQGLAWNYTYYSTDTLMPKLENYARAKHIGIWSSFHYLEPWEYRKNH